MTEEPTLYCSFCGKSSKVVKQLIAGPTVFICDECIDMCSEIIKATKEPEVNTMPNKMSKEDKITQEAYVTQFIATELLAARDYTFNPIKPSAPAIENAVFAARLIMKESYRQAEQAHKDEPDAVTKDG